jgi:tryptophan synthase alpha chain
MLADSMAPLVASMRRVSSLPLAVGFGISTAGQVRDVASIADGVVVGSAFVRTIEQNHDGDIEAALEALARELAQGLRR